MRSKLERLIGPKGELACMAPSTSYSLPLSSNRPLFIVNQLAQAFREVPNGKGDQAFRIRQKETLDLAGFPSISIAFLMDYHGFPWISYCFWPFSTGFPTRGGIVHEPRAQLAHAEPREALGHHRCLRALGPNAGASEPLGYIT